MNELLDQLKAAEEKLNEFDRLIEKYDAEKPDEKYKPVKSLIERLARARQELNARKRNLFENVADVTKLIGKREFVLQKSFSNQPNKVVLSGDYRVAWVNENKFYDIPTNVASDFPLFYPTLKAMIWTIGEYVKREPDSRVKETTLLTSSLQELCGMQQNLLHASQS